MCPSVSVCLSNLRLGRLPRNLFPSVVAGVCNRNRLRLLQAAVPSLICGVTWRAMYTEPGMPPSRSRSSSLTLDMEGPSSLMRTVKLGEDGRQLC